MEPRLQAKTLADAFKMLRGAFEAADQAGAALRDQSRRLSAGCDQLGAVRQESAKTWLDEIARTQAGARQGSVEITEGDQQAGLQLAGVNQLKADSLASLADRGAKLVKALNESAGSVKRSLTELGRKLDGTGLLAGKQRQELLRHLGETVEFFSLMDHEHREFHRELTKLHDHYAEHMELRKQRKHSIHRDQAIRVTEAGCRAMQSGDLGRAEAFFRKAHELCPSPAAVFNLALALILAGKSEASQRLLLDPALSECDPVEAQALKSLKALQARDYARSLQEAEAGLHIRPDHPVLRSLAATAALAANSAANALLHLSEADTALLKKGFAESPTGGGDLFAAPRQATSVSATQTVTGPPPGV